MLICVKKRQPSVAVSDARGVRSLHVGGEAIQSAMRLGDPFALYLDYTRCMMAFLLVHPQPREALMIGLGGGSLLEYDTSGRMTGAWDHSVSYASIAFP